MGIAFIFSTLSGLILSSGWSIFFIVLCVLIALFMLVKSIPRSIKAPVQDEQATTVTPIQVSKKNDDHIKKQTMVKPPSINFTNLYYGSFGKEISETMEYVFEKSIGVIQTTTEITELMEEYDMVLDIYDWTCYAKTRGLTISISEGNDFITEINTATNENIIRIANHAYSNYISSLEKIYIQQAVDNHAILLFRLLDECQNALRPLNREYYCGMIKNLHFLAEETYSRKSIIGS